MADSPSRKYLPSSKKPMLEISSGKTISGCKKREIQKYDPYDDEYIPQYVLYYYQFHKSETDLNAFQLVDELPLSESMTNDDVVRHVACLTIVQHNAVKGTRIAFLDNVSASYMSCGEIDAVRVDPPPPLYADDPEFPTILFTVTGPGSGYMSIPVVEFTRVPAEAELVSSL